MKQQVQWLLKIQLLITVLYPVLTGFLGWGDIISALVGCLISLLPSAYFGQRLLRQANNYDPMLWLRSAYRFEIGKWVLAALLFALAFSSAYAWDPIVLFVGYLFTQMSGLVSPYFVKGTVGNNGR
jgi:ATP synthase protein I